MDNRSRESRSALMSRIRSEDTAPEMTVRRLLHSMGYRYRLHPKNLPGKPDVVFPARRRVIFVNGCFWHAHGCKIGRPPKSKLDFWEEKLNRNRQRDEKNRIALEQAGWKVLTVWQCETKNTEWLRKTLASFMAEVRTASA
ncbi:MAG: very short patch repair endonuclease [Bryobacteraceae bacterium]